MKFECNYSKYFILPNKSAGRNKSAGWNVYNELIKVQVLIIMQAGKILQTR